jgi:PII interaction protein X
MSEETYLNHPNFGLLFRICLVESNREVFTTLYAQRLFFLVSSDQTDVAFEPMTRSEARILVESRLRLLRRDGSSLDYDSLLKIYKRTFQ